MATEPVPEVFTADDIENGILGSTPRVDVTAGDIENGVPGNPDSCPVSLAAMRAFPGAVRVAVRTDFMEVFYGATAAFYSLPDSAQNFVEAFDADGAECPGIGPFSFLPIVT